ncbi:hypothetical protein FJW04_24090 [Mesorhizobium sp. B2-7-3]|uniref:hypothetical protein n=1 Tax=Mesorhizobium sp. B2-7-3 TaxID=2589907 RepID=UPI001128DE17|nr:hypothetical protein [Mesorhizobium sp. B2-7-3]TPJ11441.1 hypothetical protein FJW04_24090 [Mesorhizobium sp. B2-7-3]
MVATVGSISIDLVTNANSFANGFKSSATTVEQQSARMAKSVAAVEKGVIGIGTTLKNFGTGLAAGVGLAALGSLSGAFDKLKSTISEYDEIATNAKQAGLKTETFQALGFAAKQANIDQEAFNASLTIFAKNAGLAERGTGALYSGLKNLNPELLRSILHTKDQEERLKLVSDALENTSNASQKAALAAVVFGKGGVEMARFLDQGRASIEAMKKAAQGLGIIVPDELLQRAGELDDKLDVLSQVIHVQLGEALINLAPVLTGAMEGFANFSKQINTTSVSLDNFVNNPSWANLEKLVVALGGKPFREGSVLDQLAKGTAGLASSSKDIADITAGIDFLTHKLAELQAQAAQGADVHIEIADATQSLNELKARLLDIQGAAAATGTAITQSFREAENASMDALAAMQKAAPAPGALPTVTGYRSGTSGPPTVTQYGAGSSDIGLIDRSSRADDSIINGVRVRKYGGQEGDPGNFLSQHTDQYGAQIYDSSKDTAGYTKDTSNNVSKLDANTKQYLQSLSSDIGGYSQQQNIVINKLSDVTAQTFGRLSSAVLAALVSKNDTEDGSTPGNGFLTHDQVFIPGMTSYGRKIGSYHLAPTTSDGTSNTSVNVQQPGSTITLNYVASPYESEATAKQRARDMFNELVRAQASA